MGRTAARIAAPMSPVLRYASQNAPSASVPHFMCRDLRICSCAVASSVAEVAVGLLDVLVTEDHEIVTIIEGEGATVGDTRHIRQWLEDNRPDVETEVHHGGQPLYPYYFGIE